MGRKLTTEEFIKKAKSVHGDKYDYSKTIYLGKDKKVCIFCKKHKKDFWQIANDHKKGSNCPDCAREENAKKRSDTLDIFIKKAKSIHGDKYDYSLVNYTNSKIPVLIKCNICGNKWKQIPNSHIMGFGCPECKKNKKEI